MYCAFSCSVLAECIYAYHLQLLFLRKQASNKWWNCLFLKREKTYNILQEELRLLCSAVPPTLFCLHVKVHTITVILIGKIVKPSSIGDWNDLVKMGWTKNLLKLLSCIPPLPPMLLCMHVNLHVRSCYSVKPLTLCLLGNLHAFLWSDVCVFSVNFKKNYFRDIIKASHSLDPDQAWPFLRPDLDPICL